MGASQTADKAAGEPGNHALPPHPRRPAAGWPRCKAQGLSCNGIQVPPYGRCLAHLVRAELDGFLGQLGPGADLDVRGTDIGDRLLSDLITAVQDGAGGPVFATAKFSEARFSGTARFTGARFGGDAWFDGACFAAEADFAGSEFKGQAVFTGSTFAASARFSNAYFRQDAAFDDAVFSEGAHFTDVVFDQSGWFSRAQFRDGAWFGGLKPDERKGASFGGLAWFESAEFSQSAWFKCARFGANAVFRKAHFSQSAVFAGAQVGGDASFAEAHFDTAGNLGPLVAKDSLNLNAAFFVRPVLIQAAATAVSLRHATFANATLRLRYVAAVLDNVTATGPVTLTEAAEAFVIPMPDAQHGLQVDESLLAGLDPGPSLVSMRGVDASLIVLVNMNLSECRFADAYNLDQLHFEGSRCRFADPPGWLWVGGRLPVWRYARRQVLAEEWDWRAQRRRFAWSGKQDALCPPLDADRLLSLYRQLRKAQEDAKNEPGAADFYYGEMEMRRYAAATPRGERAILALYWALSGYGLRSTRALLALVIVLALATVGFATFGFAGAESVRYLPIGDGRAGAGIAYQQATVPGPRPGWIAAVNYSLDSSTSLLSTSQPLPLTWPGSVVQTSVKLLGPLFLGLALLAVRNRVKR